MAAVCCESAPNESDSRAVTSSSLAGPSRTEIAKAEEHHIGPRGAFEKPGSSLLTSQRQWTSHLEYCDFGFRSSGDAALDVVRLGALCGQSNGLTKGSAWSMRFDDDTDEARRTWASSVKGKQEPSSCGRATIGLSGAHQLGVRVELRKAGATEPLFSCHLLRSGFCPERELACDVSEVHISPQEVDGSPPATDDSSNVGTDGEGLAVQLEWWALPSGSGSERLPFEQGGELQ